MLLTRTSEGNNLNSDAKGRSPRVIVRLDRTCTNITCVLVHLAYLIPIDNTAYPCTYR